MNRLIFGSHSCTWTRAFGGRLCMTGIPHDYWADQPRQDLGAASFVRIQLKCLFYVLPCTVIL